MKAVVCDSFDQALVYRDVEELADPGPSQVKIDVKAASINFPDLLMTKGKYQDTPPLPFVPGIEVAGVVDACGEDVTHVKPGDRVLATCESGCFAEQLITKQHRVIPIPDEMPFVEAAGFAIAHVSAWLGLVHRCQLSKRETVLVLGASGGIGLAATAIASASGATVIAAAGDDKKLAVCLERGANYTINYSVDGLREKIMDITRGEGVNVVFDPVGGECFEQALRCLSDEGRIALVGFSSGTIAKIPANYLLLKNIAAVGVNGSKYTKAGGKIVDNAYRQLFSWYKAGKLKPYVSQQLKMSEVEKGFSMFRSRKISGKVVLTP